MARETFLVGFRNSSDWEPNLCAKYAGRSAKPHGLTDETTPAIKANVNARMGFPMSSLVKAREERVKKEPE